MPGTRLLVVDDESDQRGLLAGFLTRRGYDVTGASGGTEALELYPSVFAPVALVDMKMPGMTGLELLTRLREINPFVQVIVLTAFGTIETAVTAMRAGAYDYLTKPVEDLEELVVKIEKAANQNRLVVEHQAMSQQLAEIFPETGILGESQAIQNVREMISLVAPRDTTVLITGASGTGKELVARAVHALSSRASKSFVAINCAAFPDTLLESELFGYERGAFTGAERTKQGRFELADGGTLFLDEIAEMPVTMQAKLLRVLEDHKIQRLGSVKSIKLDIRLVAATNRDLKRLIAEGKFREDLYYRLDVVRVHVPSLAERQGDILLLAKHFLDKCSRRLGKQIGGFDKEAAAKLIQYSWPGNVRELENVIERAVVLATSNVVTADNLAGLTLTRVSDSPPGIVPLSEIEHTQICKALERFDWNIGETAKALGIHRNTLRTKIKEYGIKRP
jgi:DNA-binding NtrC family response regulator